MNTAAQSLPLTAGLAQPNARQWSRTTHRYQDLRRRINVVGHSFCGCW
ncbi:hypothetical protein I547_6733 [Mycobacterium kansasii 824]|nr:hypothetical protein I547_6733 [Mycobacterium kansasii 824]